jgi:hypothetical protein
MKLKFIIALIILCLNSKAADFTPKVQTFLEKYCIDCHDEDVQKGGVELHELKGINQANADMWKRVWEVVALKQMPPKNKKSQPPLVDRDLLSKWITGNLDRVLADKGGFYEHYHPLKANHLDHDLLFNTDLQELNLKPTSTHARLSRITPHEQFVRYNSLLQKDPEYNQDAKGSRTHGDLNFVGNKLKISLGYNNLYPDQIGTKEKLDQYFTLSIPFNMLNFHGIKNYPDLYSVNQSDMLNVVEVSEKLLSFIIKGPTGQYAQVVSQLPKTVVLNNSLPPAENKKELKKIGKILETQPLYFKSKQSPANEAINNFLNSPTIDDTLLKKAITDLFIKLTYRRPTESELSRYHSITRSGIDLLGKEEGLISGLSSIFLNKDALFRPELANYGSPDSHGRVMLQGNELLQAMNASFSFLKPDATLIKALNEGKLKTKEDVRREFIRILKDKSIRKPRILQFFREYFEYDLALEVNKTGQSVLDSGILHLKPYYSSLDNFIPDLDAMVEYIVDIDRDVFKTLLTADYLILDPNNRMNDSYFMDENALTNGVKYRKWRETVRKSNNKDESFNRFCESVRNIDEHLKTKIQSKPYPIHVRATQSELKTSTIKNLVKFDSSERLGILTHPAWLISHSDAMDNHAVLRGKWIRERLLGDAVPDVPITVDAMLPDEPDATLRHRMRVTQDAKCWGCHQKMDPLGLPFEMYNHIGILRQQDNGKRVDASGEIIHSGDPALDGKVVNAIDMIKKLANSQRCEQVFVRHAFRFWIGRNETIDDAPVLRDAYLAYKNSKGSFRALLLSLLTSDAFLYRKVN